MAINRFTGAVDANWGTAGNWSQGTVPTATDTHTTTFDATSPNCTVNTSARVCNAIDWNGYTNTITMTFGITVSGNVTLDSTMASRVAGSGGLTINATATLTSNGGTWNNALTFSLTSIVLTFVGEWINVDTVTTSASTTFNGDILNCKGSLVGASLVNNRNTGSTIIKLTGTGTWSGYWSNPLEINTAGTITFGTTLGYGFNSNINTFTYTTGTVVTTGNSFNLIGSCSIDASGITFNTFILAGGSATFTLLGNINCSFFNPQVYGTCNGFNINVSGNYTSDRTMSGTTTVILTGTGIVTTPTSAGTIQNNLTINTSGTITISGQVYYNTGTLTYISGTITHSSSNLSIYSNATTLNTSGMIWQTITTNATITLTSDLYTVNHSQPFANPTILNGFNYYISGNLNVSTGSNLSGTTNMFLTGTGTWTNLGTTKNNLTINSGANTVTISGIVYYNTGTLTYTSGTVVTTGSTLTIGASTTLNTNSIIWNNIQSITGNQTWTLLSDLNLSGTLTTANIVYTLTVNGSYYINNSGSFIENNGSSLAGTCLGIKMIGTGTWYQVGTPDVKIPVIFDTTGTITCTAMIINGTSFTLVNGTVIWGVSDNTTFYGVSSISINSPSTNVIPRLNLQASTTTFLTDVYCSMFMTGTAGLTTVNGNNLYITKILAPINNTTTQGTTTLNLIGNVVSWYCNSNGYIKNNLNINCGTLYIGLFEGKPILNTTTNNVLYDTGTLTYIRGKVITNNSTNFTINASTRLINMHKCNLSFVTVTAGSTLTMNEFFCGTPEFKTKVRSHITTSNFNVTFTNSVQKKAFHVNVKNCTVSNRNQLNVINRDGNGGSNSGILFGESGMNGTPMNMFPVELNYPMSSGFKNNMN